MLNGYPVSDWEGKKTKTLDISFVVSSAGSHFMKQLEEICQTVVPAKSVRFHSSLLLHYISSTKLVPEATAHVCVHIHNEITDMVSISKTGNIYFASYPVGLRTLSRRIATAMGVQNHTAESMLALYADMQLEASHSRNSGVIVERVLKGWAHDYNQFLKMAEISHNVPAHIFVATEKYPKLFARLMRIPSSKAKVEPITENIYPEAIGML
jgi:cell division ATPase FtsA